MVGISVDADQLHPLFQIADLRTHVALDEGAVIINRADRTMQQGGDGRRIGNAQTDQRINTQNGGEPQNCMDVIRIL